LEKSPKNLHGFTLWEILLVLGILGIMAFLAMPVFNSSVDKTKFELHEANMLKLRSAIDLYYLDTGNYPSDIMDLINKPLNVPNWRGPYIDEIPIYPLNRNMSYALDSDGNIYLIESKT